MSNKYRWDILCLVGGFFFVFGLTIVEVGILEPRRAELASIQLELDGISVQRVTINSPNVYFEMNDYDEFKKTVREQNSTQVYLYSEYYYIFNEDYTLAWRIPRSSILAVIKTK